VSDETATKGNGWYRAASRDVDAREPLALVIAWSVAEPERVGEAVLVPPRGDSVLGRSADDAASRLEFRPMRPGPKLPASPPRNAGLSRKQLVLRAVEAGIAVERVGRVETSVNGRAIEKAILVAGDVLTIEGELVLLCEPRARAELAPGPAPPFTFGEPDAFGIVGESVRAWALRDDLAFYGSRDGHVLVTGESGAGKELAARALHVSSKRKGGPFVARNAATLPPGIIDAELFGNARNYPNAGMRERLGLLGEADGGTLFLDEIGELPETLQSHLLRVLDAGEYHRLGEDRARRADVRLVAATNRDESELKHDLLARFTLRLGVPGLNARTADIPLLARAILKRLGSADRTLVDRFFTLGEASGREEPRIDPALVVALLEHDFTSNVRELETLLVLAIAGSREHFIALTADVRARLRSMRPSEPPTPAAVTEALAAAGGNVSRAWQALGLSSRDALNRLMRKYGIEARKR